MKIAVVHPDSGWVLSVISRRMCEAMPEVFRPLPISELYSGGADGPGGLIQWHHPDDVDGFYYVDVQNCWYAMTRAFPSVDRLIHVGFFTHLDRDSAASFRLGWDKLDGVVHMAERYRTMFVANKWYPADRMALLRPGEVAAEFPLKPVTFGICQRGEHEGKGRDFLPQVIEGLAPDIKAAMRLSFLGKGWLPDGMGGIEDGQQYHGVSAYQWPEDRSLYARWHQQIDYLVIPSLWEGGPLSMLEALSTGTPIIAAEVGWVPEFNRENGVIHMYPPGNADSLRAIIACSVGWRLARRTAVVGMSYRRYAEGVLAFFEKMRERKGA